MRIDRAGGVALRRARRKALARLEERQRARRALTEDELLAVGCGGGDDKAESET